MRRVLNGPRQRGGWNTTTLGGAVALAAFMQFFVARADSHALKKRGPHPAHVALVLEKGADNYDCQCQACRNMTRGLTKDKGDGRRVSATLSALLALTVAGALAGCTQPTVADPAQPVTIELLHQQASDNGWHLAESALSDGYVSAQELSSAVANLDSCLRDAGLGFELHGTNPVDGWRPLFSVSWPGLSDAAGGERASECTSTTFNLVSAGYEISNKDVMDPGFMADVLACLDTKDYSPPPQPRSLDDLIPLGAEDPAVGLVMACVQRVGATYPDGIVVAY